MSFFAPLLVACSVVGCSADPPGSAQSWSDLWTVLIPQQSSDLGTPVLLPDTIWFQENWGYEDLEAMREAVHYAHPSVTLETGTLFDGSTGQFVRAHYPGGGVVGDSFVDVLPPGMRVEQPREIWGEVYVRFAPDWRPEGDDKTLFVLQNWTELGGPAEVNRWEIHLRSATRWFGGPYGDYENFPFVSRAGHPFDGRWHQLRFHFRMASNETTPDGAFEVWWDGVRVESRIGIRTETPPGAFFYNIALGRNADPFGSGIRDWGRLVVHVEDPGWGW